MTLQYKQELEPKEIVNIAIKQYSLDKLYVLFSGGKDSVCVLHFIATNYPDIFGGAVFTNTGLGSQETRKFVINYCKEMGWKLYLTYPQENERFQKIMLKKQLVERFYRVLWASASENSATQSKTSFIVRFSQKTETIKL